MSRSSPEQRVESRYWTPAITWREIGGFLPHLSTPHPVPARVQLGRDHPGQPLLAQGLQAGEVAGDERRERGQAGGEVGAGQAGEVGLEGGGQARHLV